MLSNAKNLFKDSRETRAILNAVSPQNGRAEIHAPLNKNWRSCRAGTFVPPETRLGGLGYRPRHPDFVFPLDRQPAIHPRIQLDQTKLFVILTNITEGIFGISPCQRNFRASERLGHPHDIQNWPAQPIPRSQSSFRPSSGCSRGKSAPIARHTRKRQKDPPVTSRPCLYGPIEM